MRLVGVDYFVAGYAQGYAVHVHYEVVVKLYLGRTDTAVPSFFPIHHHEGASIIK